MILGGRLVYRWMHPNYTIQLTKRGIFVSHLNTTVHTIICLHVLIRSLCKCVYQIIQFRICPLFGDGTLYPVKNNIIIAPG